MSPFLLSGSSGVELVLQVLGYVKCFRVSPNMHVCMYLCLSLCMCMCVCVCVICYLSMQVPGEPGWRVVKLLSVDPTNYEDAPREGIRRILEEVLLLLLLLLRGF